jgi:hypothetical protein
MCELLIRIAFPSRGTLNRSTTNPDHPIPSRSTPVQRLIRASRQLASALCMIPGKQANVGRCYSVAMSFGTQGTPFCCNPSLADRPTAASPLVGQIVATHRLCKGVMIRQRSNLSNAMVERVIRDMVAVDDPQNADFVSGIGGVSIARIIPGRRASAIGNRADVLDELSSA